VRVDSTAQDVDADEEVPRTLEEYLGFMEYIDERVPAGKSSVFLNHTLHIDIKF
jgi:hypothetical protein